MRAQCKILYVFYMLLIYIRRGKKYMRMCAFSLGRPSIFGHQDTIYYIIIVEKIYIIENRYSFG